MNAINFGYTISAARGIDRVPRLHSLRGVYGHLHGGRADEL